MSEGRIYVTWEHFDDDLARLQDREALQDALAAEYPEVKMAAIRNWASQIWPFGHRMQIGDWVVLPSKKKASIHFGKITGEYESVPEGPNPFYHTRTVDWFAQDIPRSNFDQDILYSLGAFMTICRISRNDAEARIRKMRENGWKPSTVGASPNSGESEPAEDSAGLDM